MALLSTRLARDFLLLAGCMLCHVFLNCGCGRNRQTEDATEYGCKVSDLILITNGLSSYYAETGRFPDNISALDRFVSNNAGASLYFPDRWTIYKKSSLCIGDVVVKEVEGPPTRAPMAVVFSGGGRFDYHLRYEDDNFDQ